MRGLIAVALVVLSGVSPGIAAEVPPPLVDADWVAARAGGPDLVAVDVRDRASYLRGHIPGAVDTDYRRDGWRVRDRDGTPGMFPTEPEALQRLIAAIGRMGIDNASHVVLVSYGRGAADMGMATRLYWTFKVLGHDRVSILDGGMAAYAPPRRTGKAAKPRALERGPVGAVPRTFEATLRRDMLVGSDEVADALARGAPLLDARPNLQHIGLRKSGAVARPGTLPKALSLPAEWLTENGGGRFRDGAALARLYEIAGAPTEGELFTFCNTGHWASVTWFVSHEILGNREAKMYDGSLAQWAADPANPVERKIDPR